jgi:phosphohistidine phosphatase
MLKTLHLVRHAKAELTANNSKDFYRALATSGMIDAARMARNLAETGVKPDGIIASPAERTTRTAEIFADQLKYDSEKVHYRDELYDGRLLEYLSVINEINQDFEEVILVGHNPNISYIAEYLSGADIGDIPTSGIVSIKFENLNWSEVSKKSGAMTSFVSPNQTFGF